MQSAFLQTPGAAKNGVESLEQQLRLSLQPVQVNREFVDHLHTRLTTPAGMTVEKRQNTGLSLLLIALSLLTGLFSVWLYHQFRPTRKPAQPEK